MESISRFLSDSPINTYYSVFFILACVLLLGVVANIGVLCTSGDIITLAEYQKLPNKPKAYRI